MTVDSYLIIFEKATWSFGNLTLTVNTTVKGWSCTPSTIVTDCAVQCVLFYTLSLFS